MATLMEEVAAGRIARPTSATLQLAAASASATSHFQVQLVVRVERSGPDVWQALTGVLIGIGLVALGSRGSGR